MIPKALDQITLQDGLQSLVDNQVHEGKTIEYKRDLPGTSSDDRKEFLKDVSSFANTDGGDLLFGVVEKDGIPQSFPGVPVANQDDLRLQFENRLRDGLQPRIPDVQFKFIPSASGKHVLLMRTRKSWAQPHRVIFGGHGHFYSRNSAGAYQLDVDQLRSAFLQAQTVEDRIREFRRSRVAAISVGETPVPLIAGAKYAMHLVPLSAFASRELLPMAALLESMSSFKYFDASGWCQNTNIDGVVLFESRKEPNRAYTQVYRNGCVEAVMAYERDDDPAVSAHWQERVTLKYMNQYVRALLALRVALPVFVFLSLFDARGYRLHLGQRFFREDSTLLNRDALLLPEATIQEPDFKPGLVLKPVFDMLWHAFNCPAGTTNVNDDGEWTGGGR
jgi:hypothetical protein